jgi:hypothetical protein
VLGGIETAVKCDVNPSTREAFRRPALDGLLAARPSEELTMPDNAVFVTKSRVIRRRRRKAGDLLW